jgi:hypothetical protein
VSEPSEFCPRCGTRRTGAFRFCRSCGLDFDDQTQLAQSAIAPVAPPLQAQRSAYVPVPPTGRDTGPLKALGNAFLVIATIGAGIYLFSRLTGSSGGTAADPTPTRAPVVTATPWSIDVADVTYTKRLTVGDTIDVDVTITNTGSRASLRTKFQFDGLDDYADLIGCIPECEYEELLGLYTTLPGVAAGDTVVYHVEFLAKALGVADWSICVYDEETAGEQVYCGSGSTTIGT